MILKLEELLEEECLARGLDLHVRLDRVKDSVRRIWEEPRFLWFTSHGVDHSERLVDILSDILSHLQTTRRQLGPHELYILLAACYLHDIGMQDFRIPGRGMESFTIDDYDLVRQRHPERSKELILQRSLCRGRDEFRIDLDDRPSYLVPIALVSQAHGSRYFESTVEELRALPHSPSGKGVRGALIAALLMIADELDLHEERAKFPNEMELSAISALHHHAHHYMTQVRIHPGRTSKERRVRLTINCPPDSDAYAENVVLWVVGKLQKQLRRTAAIVEEETDGELCWSDQIDVKMTVDKYGVRRPMPAAAQVELQRELAAAEVVNYAEVLQVLQVSVLKTPRNDMLCLVSDDEQARVQILEWLEAQCACRQLLLFRSDLRFEPYSPKDTFNQLQAWLLSAVEPAYSGNRNELGAVKTSGVSLTAQLDKLLEYVSDAGLRSPAVVILQNLDSAEPATIDWVTRMIPGRFRRHNIPIPVLLTCGHIPVKVHQHLNKWKLLRLGNLGKDSIAEYLQARGFNPEEAHMKAEEIFGTSSGGQPQGVIFALRRLRMMESRIRQ